MACVGTAVDGSACNGLMDVDMERDTSMRVDDTTERSLSAAGCDGRTTTGCGPKVAGAGGSGLAGRRLAARGAGRSRSPAGLAVGAGRARSAGSMTTTGGAGPREGDAVGGVVGRCRAVSAVGRFGRAGAAFSSPA